MIQLDLDQCAPAACVATISRRSEEGSMLAFSPRQRHWPVLGAFAQWWQHWIGARATELLEAARLGAGDVEYLTHDVDMSDSDLGALMRRGPDELVRRMVSLDLDPHELALSEPALLHHLQRQCMLCESRGRCLQDFARETSGSAWRDREDSREYCPNASLLDMLSALRSYSRVAPNYSLPYLG
jgi:hypothetical protein